MLNSYDYLAQTVNNAMRLVKPWDTEKVAQFSSVVDYVNQMRTIDIRVPRQCGKTKFLTDMFLRESSVFIHVRMEEQKFRPELRKYTTSNLACPTLAKLVNEIREMKCPSKIDYLLIDEPSRFKQSDTDMLILGIQLSDMISDKFMVIKLGT